MAEEINDMKPTDPGKKLPPILENTLRPLLPEKDLDLFGKQLPDDFLSDASEGLNQVKDLPQLDAVLKQLNQQLHQQLAHKKKHVNRRSMGDLRWMYWAVIIILLLVICAFLVIRILIHQ